MRFKIAVAAVGLALSYPALADYSSVYQSGTDNYAAVEQSNSGAGAYVSQYGDRNHVGQNYDGTDYAGMRQYNVISGYASVTQQGNDNWAWTYQDGGTNQTIQIQQGGWRWNGETYVDYGSANNSYASIYQYGGGANQTADVFQAGLGNYMYGYQSGSDNQMTVLQNGSWNTAYNLTQYGSGGDANVMNVSQTGTSNSVGYYYYATQSGAGNEMNITQNGNYNYVYYAQQNGTNNLMNLSQTGNGHSVYASQYGNGNVTSIKQF